VGSHAGVEGGGMTRFPETMRLKYLVRPQNRKVTYADTDRAYIGLENIDSWTGRLIEGEAVEPEGIVSLYESGEVLFGKLRPYLAKVHLATKKGACSTEALVLRVGQGYDANYLKYILLDPRRIDEINSSTFGAQMPRASWEFIGNCKIPLPDLDTQKAIAAYLDRETARIDQLIAKKEQFREAINEKRRSLTAGLVDGSLIHSGEGTGPNGWFGQVPSHWRVRRARLVFRERIDPSQDGSEELLTVSHITGVTARADKDVNMFMAETLEGYKLVRASDLVVNTMWAWMGAIGVSPIDGCASPSYAVYRPASDCFQSDYLDLVVRSLPFVAEVNRRSKGVWASRLRLYPDAFLDIPFPLPPLEEQRALVDALNARLQREEAIASKAERTIALLKERRAALITAAVTGQLDIREKLPAVTTKPDRAKWRVIVGAEIVHRHQNTKRFGRIKNQKFLYLAETHAGITELEGNYLRWAAGPYDANLINETERGMEAAGYFRAQPPDGDSKGVTYVALSNAGKHADSLKSLLGDRATELRRIIDLMHSFDTETVEAIATLYAVWNDALMDGEEVDDARVIRGVLTEWDPEKEKFKPEQLRHWLDWMKRNRLIPHGHGPRTKPTMTPRLL
jgi:restriction endonuclease S subunit